MPRRGSGSRAMVLAAGLAGWLIVVAARPALARADRAGRRPPRPAGGAVRRRPWRADRLRPKPGRGAEGRGAAAGDTAMGAFTAFFTDGPMVVEKLKEFLVGADRPDLSVDWWVSATS